MVNRYDLIIAGGGCAGLNMALALLQYPVWQQKRILIIDKELKTGNDRTWCFWTRTPEQFQPILHKTWDNIRFTSKGGATKVQRIRPYTYCMVRSADFYADAYRQIRQYPGVDFLHGHIEELRNTPAYAEVHIEGETYRAPLVFNSCFTTEQLRSKAPSNAIWQHFKGWWIRTEKPVFHPDEAVLMDFQTPQTQGGHFLYVLPISTHEALVEYTVFSEALLPQSAYEQALEHYLKSVSNVDAYSIEEKEFGVIPMFPLDETQGAESRIIPIGALGGAVKPTTGYAFLRIRKQTQLMAQRLSKGLHPVIPRRKSTRFGFYDGLLLHLLQTRGSETARIFESLFMRNAFAHILRFLDEESHLGQEAAIFATLPHGLFLRALWERHIQKPTLALQPVLSISNNRFR